MHHAASQVSSICHDAQDRLLWRGKTCPAHHELVSFINVVITIIIINIYLFCYLS